MFNAFVYALRRQADYDLGFRIRETSGLSETVSQTDPQWVFVDPSD